MEYEFSTGLELPESEDPLTALTQGPKPTNPDMGLPEAPTILGGRPSHRPDPPEWLPPARMPGPPSPRRDAPSAPNHYRQMFEEQLLNEPQRPKPGWQQAIAAGLVGGTTGYLNSSPAPAAHQDPRTTNEIFQQIELGDYPERLAEHQRKLKGLGTLADMEAGDERYSSAIERERLRQDATTGRAIQGFEVKKEIAGGANATKEKVAGINAEAGAKRATIRNERDMIPISQIDPDYIEAHGLEDAPEDTKISRYAYSTWMRGHSADADRESREEIAKAARELKDKVSQREAVLSLQRIDNMKRRTDEYIRRGADGAGGKEVDYKALKEYSGSTSRAEKEAFDETLKLNRQFKIGAGFDTNATPESLPAEAKKYYFSARQQIEQKLLQDKTKASTLYATRVGKKEPDDFTDDHKDALEYFAKQAVGDQPNPQSKGTPAKTPTPAAKPTTNGQAVSRRIFTPEFLKENGFMSAADAEAAAIKNGYKVIP